MTVGQRIKKLREERGWSQMYLAIEARVGQSCVYEWEKEVVYPNLISFFRICWAFEMTLDEFMKGVEIE